MRTTETGERRRALIVAAAVVAGSLVLGGAAVALDRTLRSGEGNGPSAHVQTDQNGRAAETGSPTATPNTPTPNTAEFRGVTTALTGAGYACYESVTRPVVVHTCYLDPGTRSLDHQTVRVRAAADGSVAAVEVRISYFEKPAPALDLFRKTVGALEGTVLNAREARAVVDSRGKDDVPQSPGVHSALRLGWGTSTLFVPDRKDSFTLDLVARGARLRTIPAGDTEAGLVDTQTYYSDKGFHCTLDRAADSLKCQRRVTGAIYTIIAVDPCLGRGKKFELVCKGREATEVRASIGFDTDLPQQTFEEIVTFMVESTDQSMGGMAAETRQWLMKSINDAKVHRADFQGMNIEFEPGAGANEGFQNVVSVTVGGLNFST